MKTLLALTLILLVISSQSFCDQQSQKSRVIILTDIEADPDDTESLVRLFLYSNAVDIRGIIATTSVWKQTSVAPESIKRVIRAYGKVRSNLLKHEPGFPVAETLLSKVKHGLAKYGMQGVGDGRDSEGSEWIIRVLEEKDKRPLWVSVWGGVNTLAQALYTIEKTRTKAEAKQLIAKLRVYTISDQDDSGVWIRKNFPDLFYIVSPGDDYGSATWSAINTHVNGIDNGEISNRWLAHNIQQGHGPLGAVYPDVAYGMEGDTPSWLNLVPNGLTDPEHPNWGGWGGRYEMYVPDFDPQKKGGSGVPREPETHAIWTDASDTFARLLPNEDGRAVRVDTGTFAGNKVTLWRWRDDFQNDFAARMDWCTKSYKEANHPPIPVLAHPHEFTVRSGDVFCLDAFGSSDPDGDNLSFLWFQYPEAGSYKKPIQINGAENLARLFITAPEVERNETVHFIVKVTDKGTPPLSRYARVIVNIQPKAKS